MIENDFPIIDIPSKKELLERFQAPECPMTPDGFYYIFYGALLCRLGIHLHSWDKKEQQWVMAIDESDLRRFGLI